MPSTARYCSAFASRAQQHPHGLRTPSGQLPTRTSFAIPRTFTQPLTPPLPPSHRRRARGVNGDCVLRRLHARLPRGAARGPPGGARAPRAAAHQGRVAHLRARRPHRRALLDARGAPHGHALRGERHHHGARAAVRVGRRGGGGCGGGCDCQRRRPEVATNPAAASDSGNSSCVAYCLSCCLAASCGRQWRSLCSCIALGWQAAARLPEACQREAASVCKHAASRCCIPRSLLWVAARPPPPHATHLHPLSALARLCKPGALTFSRPLALPPLPLVPFLSQLAAAHRPAGPGAHAVAATVHPSPTPC